MTEPIYNLFLFVERGSIREIGAVAHQCSGSDADKMRFLQGKVNDDYRVCRRFPLPDWCATVTESGTRRGVISYEAFITAQRLGMHMDILEVAFEAMNAPPQPLLVVTPIVDGTPRINAVTDLTPEMAPVKWE